MNDLILLEGYLEEFRRYKDEYTVEKIYKYKVDVILNLFKILSKHTKKDTKVDFFIENHNLNYKMFVESLKSYNVLDSFVILYVEQSHEKIYTNFREWYTYLQEFYSNT